MVEVSFEVYRGSRNWAAADLALLAVDAGFHWQSEWIPTDEFLDLCDVTTLIELATESKLKLDGDEDDQTKAGLVELIQTARRSRKIKPPEFVCRILGASKK